MKFTLEETIKNHREMWLWISQKIMEDAKHGIAREIECYKRSYRLNILGTRYPIRNDCFCCHYVTRTARTGCDGCPFYWNNRKEERLCCSRKSYYNMLIFRLHKMVNDGVEYEEAKKCATLAYKIAMLPVREENK